MAHYIHFKDPKSPELEQFVSTIPSCPGTCLFMDVVGSTRLKYEASVSTWARKLNNTFNILLYANHLEQFVVKGIGDELMLYIPDGDLRARASDNDHFSLVENIASALFLLQQRPDVFLACKVALHHCADAYNISYFERANDYYGKDIDLAARLMGKTVENRIVMSEAYYAKALDDLQRGGRPATEGCFGEISSRRLARFRGVPTMTAYRTIDT